MVAVFVALAGVVFVGCEKTQEIGKDYNSEQIYDEYTLPELLKTGFTIVEGVPTFESRESYMEICDLLEKEYYKWNENFFNKWKHLGEEGVEAKAEELNFNHYLPYEAFENYHNIKTLWSAIKKQEEEWLNHEELDFDRNPTNHSLSETGRPFANVYGEYAIGKSIYHVEREGIIYEITDGDYSKLEKIRKGIDNSKGVENVVVHNLDKITDCKGSCVAYHNEEDFVDYGPKCMYMILDLDWDGYGSAAKAKTKAYKQKSNGKWGYWYTRCYAEVFIQCYDSDCNWIKDMTDWKENGFAWYTSVHVYRAGAGIRTQSGYNNGAWSFWGKFKISSYNYSTLAWE